MTDSAVVVYISPTIASCYAAWCLEPIAGIPVIRRLVERLTWGLAEIEIHVVLHDDVLPARVEAALRGLAVQRFRAKALGRLAALVELATAHPHLETLLVMPENAVFPDCELTRAMLGEHRRAQADVTSAPDAPIGLVPEIYARTTILRLAALGLPDDVSGDLLAVIAQANQLDEPALRFKTRVFPLPERTRFVELPSRVLVEDLPSLRAAETVARELPAAPDSTQAMRFKVELLRPRPLEISAPLPAAGRLPILFATQFTAYSGAEACFCDLIANLDRRRFHPVVVLPSRGVLADRLVNAGVAVEILPVPFDRLTPSAVDYFRALLGTLQIRLVHVNVTAGPALTLAAYHAGIPIVTHVRSYVGRAVDDLLVFSSKIITVSKAVRDDLLRSNVRPESVVAIYDGQPLDSFQPAHHDRATLRRQAEIAPNRAVIAMIARVCAQKRQRLLIEALPWVVERVPEALVLFVGEAYPKDATYHRSVLDLIAERRLEAHVRFWGFEHEIARIHALSDVLVMCGEREGFGHCIQEAMAMGMPTVTPRRGGGHVEIIEDGISGLLYEDGDPRKLAAAIVRLLRDPGLGRRIAKTARRAIEALDIRAHVDAVSGIYDQLLTA